MTPDLDLTKRQWTKTRGGVTAIGTWIRLDGSFKPCMVLIPAGREYDERLIPCVVTQDRAWIWSEDVGDPAQSAPIAFSFAETLGLSVHEPRNIIFVASFIHDMLGDLLHIPPYQNDSKVSVAEATLIDNGTGKVVGETEIIEQ
ncbi:hypothetical protein [Rhizobium sp. 18065]|uniref:hypothetical protein n=1 Tax=Rhizobium sp. 18065 TaxID=2681411 RepID=UPI0013581394|nr:hypothetical protein [Rhizobium sp. 18065]